MNLVSVPSTAVLVRQAFHGMIDKGGDPYYNHLVEVANGVKDRPEYVVMAALMHDLIEDTEYTIQDLHVLGYPQPTIDIVELLTRDETEEYGDYIDRIAESENLEAIRVKVADLQHNLSEPRLGNVSVKDRARLRAKYEPALSRLISLL